MEWFVDLLKYIIPPANVNAHSLHITVDIYLPRSVKEGIRGQRITNSGSNVHVLG